MNRGGGRIVNKLGTTPAGTIVSTLDAPDFTITLYPEYGDLGSQGSRRHGDGTILIGISPLAEVTPGAWVIHTLAVELPGIAGRRYPGSDDRAVTRHGQGMKVVIL